MIGLAPIRPDLKGRLRELLCIHGLRELESWWEVLVTLQFVASDTYFVTPDLQSGSRITSQMK